jgi:hypothetical protein
MSMLVEDSIVAFVAVEEFGWRMSGRPVADHLHELDVCVSVRCDRIFRMTGVVVSEFDDELATPKNLEGVRTCLVAEPLFRAAALDLPDKLGVNARRALGQLVE